MNGQCQMEGCEEKAVCTVHAQWTGVDFIEYEVCEDCELDIILELESRLVEGQLPLHIWTSWYGEDS